MGSIHQWRWWKLFHNIHIVWRNQLALCSSLLFDIWHIRYVGSANHFYEKPIKWNVKNWFRCDLNNHHHHYFLVLFATIHVCYVCVCFCWKHSIVILLTTPKFLLTWLTLRICSRLKMAQPTTTSQSSSSSSKTSVLWVVCQPSAKFPQYVCL